MRNVSKITQARIQNIFSKNKAKYSLFVMVFFWAIYSGLIAYISPILIVGNGFSNTQLGFIISISAISGIIFDVLLTQIIKKPHYRKFFLGMFACCFLLPLLFSLSNVIFFLLASMMLWGLYIDLYYFGTFDFISRNTKQSETTLTLGIIQLLKSSGLIAAPLIIGLLGGNILGWQVPMAMYILILISFIFFIFLIIFSAKSEKKTDIEFPKSGLIVELQRWKKYGLIIAPVLIFTFALRNLDSTILTIGPLLSEVYRNSFNIDGIVIMAYIIPTIITGMFIYNLTKFFGKKKLSLYSLLIGCTILTSLFIQSNQYFIILTIFIAAFFTSIALPSINGVYVDFIREKEMMEEDFEGMEGIATNFGFISGHILSGVFADLLGYKDSLAAISLLIAVIVIVLIFVTPKTINVDV